MTYPLELKEKEGISYLTSPKLMKERSIFICFTTRKGGFSQPPFSQLNLSFHVGDKEHLVLENRQKLASVIGFDIARLTCAKQVHSNQVFTVKKSSVGKGAISYDQAIEGVDALVTSFKAVPLALFFADCLPLILVSIDKPKVAVAHAGWKGIYKGIVLKLMDELTKEHSPQFLRAFIGPTIGPCCYKVPAERMKVFREIFPLLGGSGLDLARIAEKQLLDSGLKLEHIIKADLCTSCNHNDYYSYRVQARTGRQAALAMIV